MTDQELLQAIGQVIEAKLDPVRQDICELKGSVQRLDGRMDQLESRIKQLELGMDKLKNQTEELEEKVNGIRIYMDTEQKRTMNLLLEGQQALWDRFVPNEEYDSLKERTEVLELVVKRHSQEIRELQLA